MKTFVIGHCNLYENDLKLIIQQGEDKYHVLVNYLELKGFFEGYKEEDYPQTIEDACAHAFDGDQVIAIKEIPSIN